MRRNCGEWLPRPPASALAAIGLPHGQLIQTSPFEAFNILWMKTALVASLFVAAPWVIYQAWAFIAPGLYQRERRLAVSFIASTAGLFLAGGAFAYFVALPRGLAFLLGVGRGEIAVLVTVSEYFGAFVNVVLGIALVFELPVLIVFLTVLRIVSPGFLLRHARYAILAVFIVSSAVTQTTDVFNLILFAVPLCVLYYVGSSPVTFWYSVGRIADSLRRCSLSSWPWSWRSPYRSAPWPRSNTAIGSDAAFGIRGRFACDLARLVASEIGHG